MTVFGLEGDGLWERTAYNRSAVIFAVLSFTVLLVFVSIEHGNFLSAQNSGTRDSMNWEVNKVPLLFCDAASGTCPTCPAPTADSPHRPQFADSPRPSQHPAQFVGQTSDARTFDARANAHAHARMHRRRAS